MNKLKYIFKRIRDMDYGMMIKRAQLVSKRSGKFTLYIFIDMLYCGFKYQAGYEDYRLFHFEKLNHKQRLTYITRGINDQFVKKLNGGSEDWVYFNDKRLFNQTFSEAIGRKWMDLSNSTYEAFEQWVADLEQLIIKPIDALCGKGIEKLNCSDFSTTKELYDYIMKSESILVEEVIIQHQRLSAVYNRSVNTIRVVTIVQKGKVYIPFTCIRIGNDGYVVDNLNFGGMAAKIDVNTGIVISDAADKHEKTYINHPISGHTIKGLEIPMWNEVLEFVKGVALKIQGMGYVGWDVAITANGPVLIEGNHFPGHDIYQLPVYVVDGYGILPEFKQIANL